MQILFLHRIINQLCVDSFICKSDYSQDCLCSNFQFFALIDTEMMREMVEEEPVRKYTLVYL